MPNAPLLPQAGPPDPTGVDAQGVHAGGVPRRRAAWRDQPRRLLLGLVRAYRYFLKPWLGNACRFEPTCSAYAMQALECHGAAAGSYLAARRLLRCHPWCAGGCDPVPAQAPALFTRLLAKTRS